eukprot:gnl/MRDRNA2_/MRDRNA2_84260_c0_seq4.p1 gnl/MRDRNA2_/MRDRNA2_84260_c0~~gnl/MRDRNA2_/MRDRNA2_84260_c0_seq4.p1  ORF type:complete len:1564 (-),score=326.01 gnl/MRDRNA2_/MRDRNA2_84260_c0_seq4:74-4213(-)
MAPSVSSQCEVSVQKLVRRNSGDFPADSPAMKVRDDLDLSDIVHEALEQREKREREEKARKTTASGNLPDASGTDQEAEPDYKQAWLDAGGEAACKKYAAWQKDMIAAFADKTYPYQTFVRTLPELYRKAKRAQQPFAEEVTRLAKEVAPGGTVVPTPMPSEYSIQKASELIGSGNLETDSESQKAYFFKDLKGWKRAAAKGSIKCLDSNGQVAWYRLTDISRFTIVYDNWEQVYDAAQKIMNDKWNNVVDFNDRIPEGGKRRYSDFLFLIRHENFVHELQLNARPMVDIKQKCGHKVYENQRFRNEKCLNAASFNHYKVVANVFAEGADLYTRDSDGRTPLMLAAKAGHIMTMRLLLALGADVAAQDYQGNTALHLAAQKGWVQASWLLLTEGKACTGMLTYEGRTVLEMTESFDTRIMLRSHNNLLGSKLKTAIENGEVQQVKELLDNGASVAAALNYGNESKQKEPVWSYAAKAENREISYLMMSSVLAAKACPNSGSAQANKYLRSAANLALEAGNRLTAEFLADKLKGIDCPDYSKLLKTALMARPQESCMLAAKAIINCARKEFPSATKLINAISVMEKLVFLCDEFGAQHDQTSTKTLLEKHDVVQSVALLLRDMMKLEDDSIRHTRNGTGSLLLHTGSGSGLLDLQQSGTMSENHAEGWLSGFADWTNDKERAKVRKSLIKSSITLFHRAMVGNPSLRNVLRDKKVYEFILRAAKEYPEDEEISGESIQCLAQLTTCNATAIRKAGGMQFVVDTMKRHKTNEIINNFGSGVLRSFAEWEGREEVAKNGEVLKVTLRAMALPSRDTPTVQRVQKYGFEILHNILLSTKRDQLGKGKAESLTAENLVTRAMWRFPELEKKGNMILKCLTEPRLTILINLPETMVDLKRLIAQLKSRKRSRFNLATMQQAVEEVIDETSPESVNGFLQGFYDLEPVAYAPHALEKLLEKHDVFLVVPPKIRNICIASVAMRWVNNHLGRSWLNRMIITERVDLVHGDMYLGAIDPSVAGAKIIGDSNDVSPQVSRHSTSEKEAPTEAPKEAPKEAKHSILENEPTKEAKPMLTREESKRWSLESSLRHPDTSGNKRLKPTWRFVPYSHTAESSEANEERIVGWSDSLDKIDELARKGGAARRHELPNERFVLVDQDNTFTNFNEQVVKIAEKEMGLTPFTLCSRAYEGYDSVHEQDIKRIFNRKGFIESLSPMNGALEAIKRLGKKYEVFLVTAPPKTEYAASEKIEWVSNHLGPEWVSRMVITDQKTLVFGNILIDDAPKPLGTNAFTPHWTHFPFKQPWNEGMERRVDWTPVKSSGVDSDLNGEETVETHAEKQVAAFYKERDAKARHHSDEDLTYFLAKELATEETEVPRSPACKALNPAG